MGLGPKQLQMRVPLDQLKDRVCECGGMVFSQVFMLKEIPALYSQSRQAETSMILAGFVCIACGKPMSLRPEPPKEKTEGVEEGPQKESGIVLATH